MKKIIFILAILISFTFAGCSQKVTQQQTPIKTREEIRMMAYQSQQNSDTVQYNDESGSESGENDLQPNENDLQTYYDEYSEYSSSSYDPDVNIYININPIPNNYWTPYYSYSWYYPYPYYSYNWYYPYYGYPYYGCYSYYSGYYPYYYGYHHPYWGNHGWNDRGYMTDTYYGRRYGNQTPNHQNQRVISNQPQKPIQNQKTIQPKRTVGDDVYYQRRKNTQNYTSPNYKKAKSNQKYTRPIQRTTPTRTTQPTPKYRQPTRTTPPTRNSYTPSNRSYSSPRSTPSRSYSSPSRSTPSRNGGSMGGKRR